MNSVRAACDTLPLSTIATKYLNCRNSICPLDHCLWGAAGDAVQPCQSRSVLVKYGRSADLPVQKSWRIMAQNDADDKYSTRIDGARRPSHRESRTAVLLLLSPRFGGLIHNRQHLAR
jgi:hypothetical protein